MTGPGGGLIFFVDHQDEYATYDYLEVAPTTATFASGALTGPFATNSLNCGQLQNQDCRTNSIYVFTGTNEDTSLEWQKHKGLFAGQVATTHIVNRFNAGSVPKNTYAAGVADDYETNGKTDWWLPSLDELAKIQKNIVNQGLMNVGTSGYWSSSEYTYWSSSNIVASYSYYARLDWNIMSQNLKTASSAVLPVRGF